MLSVSHVVSSACQAVGVADRNTIPDSRMTASSYAGSSYYSHYGRLNGNSQYGAWCPGNARVRTQYLQVDMGAVYFVCAVATQGDKMHDEWTTSYKLHFSLDGNIWDTYKENSAIKVRKLKCLS